MVIQKHALSSVNAMSLKKKKVGLRGEKRQTRHRARQQLHVCDVRVLLKNLPFWLPCEFSITVNSFRVKQEIISVRSVCYSRMTYVQVTETNLS